MIERLRARHERKAARGFWSRVASAFAAPLIVAAGLALGIGTCTLLVHLGAIPVVNSQRSEHVPASPVPYAPHQDRVSDLLERHGCWTKDAPTDMVGKFPGHAVLTVLTPKGLRIRYAHGTLVDDALHVVLDHESRPRIARVHGFCR